MRSSDTKAGAPQTTGVATRALEEVARRHALLIRAQVEVARAEQDLDRSLGIVAGFAHEITRGTGAVVELAEGEDMIYRAASGTAVQHLGLRLKRTESLSGLCVLEQRPLRCADTEEDTRVDREACRRIGMRSMIVVPVQYNQDIIGVLKVYSDQPHVFAEEDTAILQLMVGTIVTSTSRLAEREARQALQIKDERLRLAVEGAEIGTWHWEIDSDTQVWSDKCKEMLGLASGTDTGFTQFLACVHPDDSERIRGEVAAALATGSDLVNEYRVVWPDGSVHWIAARGRPYYDAAGIPSRFEGILQNVDVRKQSEAAAREYQAHLENMNARLQRAMQETHHSVKNNLQVIFALIEMQASEYPEFLPAAELARLGLQVRALAALHDILTETAKSQEEAELISSDAILNKLGQILERAAPQKRLHFQVEDVLLTVRQGASVALLIIELVSHAARRGGMHIWVTLHKNRTKARLEIVDDGPASPPLPPGEQDAHMGLELIRNLVEWDLRGEIRWENRGLTGASVEVLFPLSRPPSGGTMRNRTRRGATS